MSAFDTDRKWVPFYEELADRLMSFRSDRKKLAQTVYECAIREGTSTEIYIDHYRDGTREVLNDICPFTAMGSFNRSSGKASWERRTLIAMDLAEKLNIKAKVPTSFQGIPTKMPMSSWFFGFHKDRNLDDIDKNWSLFESAIRLAESEDPNTKNLKEDFIQKFDTCQNDVKWAGATTLTIGLFWCRPRFFPALDGHSIEWIRSRLNVSVPKSLSGSSYLDIRNRLATRFEEPIAEITSFVQLSAIAYTSQSPIDQSPITQLIATAIHERYYTGDRETLRIQVTGLANKYRMNQYSAKQEDVCPFDTLSMLSRQERDNFDTQSRIYQDFSELLDLPIDLSTLNKIALPKLNNANIAHLRRATVTSGPSAFAERWDLFDAALSFAQSNDSESRTDFLREYDAVRKHEGINWKLTWFLYMLSPTSFPCLDQSRLEFQRNTMGLKPPQHDVQRVYSAKDYLIYRQTLLDLFASDKGNVRPIASFPELEAFYQESNANQDSQIGLDSTPYTVKTLHQEGCFLDQDRIASILERLRNKRNVILQGPPGTGKTWLAKRLAYALIGIQTREQLVAIQFHPNISYEDFVRGFRPNSDGKLELVDGPFLRTARLALEDSESDYVVVIEEINRGNPAQVFGEMLTLLETDKRTENEALALSYSSPNEGSRELIHLPTNLYVIGTMNTADRSIAIVDFALRRRFAFVELKPVFNDAWLEWVQAKGGFDAEFAEKIRERIESLNSEIEGDASLGSDFLIGHSFFTPNEQIDNPTIWYETVVETEILPLLREYWLDDPERVKNVSTKLLLPT